MHSFLKEHFTDLFALYSWPCFEKNSHTLEQRNESTKINAALKDGKESEACGDIASLITKWDSDNISEERVEETLRSCPKPNYSAAMPTCGIASCSKGLAFIGPKNFFTYDSRAPLALNLLWYRSPSNDLHSSFPLTASRSQKGYNLIFEIKTQNRNTKTIASHQTAAFDANLNLLNLFFAF